MGAFGNFEVRILTFEVYLGFGGLGFDLRCLTRMWCTMKLFYREIRELHESLLGLCAWVDGFFLNHGRH